MDRSLDVSFDGWTLCRETGELLNGDRRVRLPIQSALVLDELVSHPGELVPRAALIAKLWPRGVVDYDTALNTIVHRLRVALGDHAEQPKYIETVPRRGYRFIGRLDGPDTRPSAEALAPKRRQDATPEAAATHLPQRREPVSLFRVPTAAALAAVLLLALGGAFAVRGERPGGQVSPEVSSRSQAAVAHVARARFLLQRRNQGDVALARQSFLEAIREDARCAVAWAGLASTHWLDVAEGRESEAKGMPLLIAAARRAVELDPGLGEAHVRLAQAYGRRGEAAAADAHLRRASELAPDDPLVLARAVDRALAAGRLGQAIEVQRSILLAEPLSEAARQNLFALLLQAGRTEEATVENERIGELNPQSESFLVNQADLWIIQGRYDDALMAASRMGAKADRDFYRALALHGQGHAGPAEASLRALMHSSGEADAHWRIAEAQAMLGQRDAAIETLERGGGCNRSWLRHSPYLRSLDENPRWVAWLQSTQPHGTG